MKKLTSTIITISILFFGSYSFSVRAADGMEKTTKHRPEGIFFSLDYIIEYMGAPNWMDVCYELEDSDEICFGKSRDECADECVKEADNWEKWYKQNV